MEDFENVIPEFGNCGEQKMSKKAQKKQEYIQSHLTAEDQNF
jgi:hypothetical protein